ncbi:uncharacterized protein LOC122242910 [Penaeus japonicus]|uniref:uncharacterized protein LOC122242910 n=1 Tax=Penaeus japonicus TaxID=27405 RepID=UPI001C712C5F|nr:uncharacterized protein LOC122242910 [Penaeus japonicus]
MSSTMVADGVWPSRWAVRCCLIWMAVVSLQVAEANTDSICRDQYAACKLLANQDECDTNRDFMRSRCPKSCDYCNGGSSAAAGLEGASGPATATESVAPDRIKERGSFAVERRKVVSNHPRAKRTIMFGGRRGRRRGNRGSMRYGGRRPGSGGSRGHRTRGGGRRGRRQRGRSGCDFLSRIFGKCGGSGRGRRGRGRRPGGHGVYRTRPSQRQTFWPMQSFKQSLSRGRQSNSVW